MRRKFLERIADEFRLRRMLSDLPKTSTLSARQVSGVLSVYRKLYTSTSAICTKMINDLDFVTLYPKPLDVPATLIIHYLSERITVTPFHIINIITRDPGFGHSDIAALNRGLFESAVNARFLMTGESEHRLRQFIVFSAEQELRLQDSMKKWLDSDDPMIRKRAQRQFSIKNATTYAKVQELKQRCGNVSGYPSLRDRCKAVGPIWLFYYDAKYRGLSSWQHGDATRACFAQSMRQIDSERAEQPVFESLAQCAWAWDLIYEYSLSLASQCSDTPDVKETLNNLNQAGFGAMAHYTRNAAVKFQGDGE